MNNIYKVIWSKAKNCYVVASEIARSHTKSASGSEKIGGGTRRKLLASLMALSLLCGGLGVAEAAVVHVNEGTGVTYAVYTTDQTYSSEMVDEKLNSKADATVVVTNTKDIATNKDNITRLENNKADKTYVDTEVGKKADKTYVDNAVAGAITTAGNDVNTKLENYAKTTEVVDKIAAEATARDTAINTAIGQERNDRTEAINNAINGEVANRDQAIHVAIQQEVTARDLAIANAKTELKEKVTAEETNRKEEDAKLEGKITENTNAINNEKTAREAAVTDLSKRIGTVDEDGQYIKKSATNNVSENLKVLDNRAKTNADAIAAEATERKNKDTELEKKITKNSEYIATLDGKVTTDINDLKAKDTELEGKIKTNTDNIAATDKRTAGIDRIDATKETTIEGNVTVDNLGNVKAKGQLTGKGVDAGTGDITTKGAVNAGSLNVTDASNLKGDVTMDKKLSVTGDTSLGKTDVGGALTVTGESSLKNTTVGGTLGVTGETTLGGTLTAEKDAKFEKDVTVEGTTNLQNTTVTGNLNVTGTITTDKMIFGDKVNSNYTEIDHGKVTSKNHEVNAAGEIISSSSTFDAEKNEVGFVNNATGDQSYHKQTSDVIMDNVKDGENSNNRTQTKTETKDIITDKDGNSSTTSQTASENKTYLTDKERKNTNSTSDTAKGYDKTIKGENGKTSTTQDELNITNTAKDGTITNEAKDIVNTASTMKTTVTGKATESYGELDTTVTGAENHTVTGKQTNTVGGGQENNISGGQKNNILTGNQETTVSNGSIINKAENGDISNTAKNVTNVGTESVTNKVGANEVKVSSTDGVDITAEAGKKITESVGTASRVVENDKITDTAGNSNVTTEKDKGTTFGNGSTGTTNIYGDSINTGTIKAKDTTTDKLTAGAAAGVDGGRLTVDADGVKGSYKSGEYTSRSYILHNTLMSGVDNGKKPTDADFKGSRTDHYMDGNNAKLDETVKDADGSNVTNKTSTGTVTTITDGTTTTKTEQGVKDITNTATGGTIKNDAKVITNKASEVINNEAININNTATGIITSKASEIKNQADKLISNKVGENTWENMEDGKITTSIKDGTKQNLTQSDAAGTKHSTVDGAKSTVTIQNADGLQTGVTNGTSTNASATTATSSAQTIASGGKANSVITTIDGTQFVNSEAATPVTGASGDGTHLNTTIKGNTITTGKVTMDYAEVMKDLGVKGNANITGKTTTGSLEVKGESKLTGNVTMESNATVKKDLNVEGITTTKTLKVTENAEIDGNATIKGDVTARSYKVGDKTYISADGINANNQKITNVADGSISEGSKDAVNGGQLYGMKMDLEHKVDKVGANAAAMANLHPMEFDPDSKWNIAAAMGNYGSETATAIGAFYRPNEDVMVNFSTAFGTGENMFGGGVSVRLGKGSNKLSREESNALKDQVNDLTARMDALLSVLNPNMSKDFPDVPENHWAYEAVSRLAGNDIVQGYPDGEFHGERTMTRYEMAEIIYNALSRGAEAERELVEEFKPELQAMAASEKATAERAEG